MKGNKRKKMWGRGVVVVVGVFCHLFFSVILSRWGSYF